MPPVYSANSWCYSRERIKRNNQPTTTTTTTTTTQPASIFRGDMEIMEFDGIWVSGILLSSPMCPSPRPSLWWTTWSHEPQHDRREPSENQGLRASECRQEMTAWERGEELPSRKLRVKRAWKDGQNPKENESSSINFQGWAVSFREGSDWKMMEHLENGDVSLHVLLKRMTMDD